MSNVLNFNLDDIGSPEDVKETMGIAASLFMSYALTLSKLGYSYDDIFKIIEEIFMISIDRATGSFYSMVPVIVSMTYTLSDHSVDGFISTFRKMEELSKDEENKRN